MDEQDKEQKSESITIRRVVALIGIFLITLGEYMVFAAPAVEGQTFPPKLWISIAGIGLLILSHYLRPIPALQSRFKRFQFSDRTLWVITSLFLSGLTVMTVDLFQRRSQTNYLPALFTWFASGVIFILAFRDRSISDIDIGKWLKDHKVELLLVGATIVLAAILRFYKLGVLPKVIDGDEGALGLAAQSTLYSELANPFTLWANFGALYLQATNSLFSLFGVSPTTLRLLPAISGVIAIPATYLFARQVAGKRIAIIAAFLLAISHSHIQFSRIASVGYIHSTWLVPLELYFLLSGLEKRSSWRAALGGVLLAFHFTIYLTSQIIAALILVFMILAYLMLKSWFRPALRQALAFWGGFIVMFAPELNYILQNPASFFDRLSQNGTFQTGWLATTVATTGRPAVQVLANRVIHAFLSLIYYPAIDFYGATIPMLEIFSALLFLIGLGIVFMRLKSPGLLLLMGYFWAPTLAIGIFSIPPNSDGYRMLIVLPPALIMAAIGLDQVLSLFGVEWPHSSRAYIFLASSLMLAAAVINVSYYYLDFVGRCKYGDNLLTRFASYLGVYAGSVDKNSPIYLLSDQDYYYGSHPSVGFLSNQRPITNYPGPMDTYQIQYGETIIASPYRIDELKQWAAAHPGGKMDNVYDCQNEILASYQIPEKTFGP